MFKIFIFFFLSFFISPVFSSDNDVLHRFSFIDSDVVPIIDFISTANNLPVLLSEPVTEKFTFFSSRPLPLSLINDRFVALFNSRGYDVYFNEKSISITKTKTSHNGYYSSTYYPKNVDASVYKDILTSFVSQSQDDYFNYSVNSDSVSFVSSFKISDSINKIIKSIDVSDSFKIKRIESSFKFDDPVSSFKLKSFYRNNDVVFFSGSASSVSRFESFLDSRSKPDLITKTLVLNSVKPSDFVSSASDLFPDVSFKAFDSNNIVAFKCVSSVCDSVVSFINSVDLMPQQIYLELYFLQAGSDFKKEFGFSLFSNNANISYDSSVSSTGATSLSGSSFLINYDTASSIFRFLNSDSTSHIVSSPRVIVSSGKKTILSSGQEVPFNTGSYRASSDGLTSQPFSTVQRKDVGLKIEATPFYFNDGNINFNLSVELSSIIPKSRDSVGAVDLVTSKKSFITEFSVKNDSWIVLAGLDENSLNDSSNSLPFFSWLGFDSTSLSDKTFLIIANIKKI